MNVKGFILLTMIGLVLAACRSSSDCFREDVFCAALVTDTQGIDDHGINQDAWAGLQEAQATGLADQVGYIESVDARDYEKNISYFASRGYDVIFTSGIALEDETLQSADLYPDSVFVGLNQPFEESRPNLVSVTFPEDQMGFAAGTLAAKLTKTGMVGAVCETSGIDSMWRYCEGFRAGAKFAAGLAETDISISILYRENGDSERLFLDESWGYETAESLIARGVDVIFAAGGLTGQAALRAASDLGVMAIGTERDQAATLGVSASGVVTSFFGQTSFEVQEVMRLLRARGIPGARVGQIQFVPFRSNLPESLSFELETLLKALSEEEILTEVPPESR